MIIAKNIKYKDKFYSAITDDTRVVSALLAGESLEGYENINLESLLLVKCKQNASFVVKL